MHFVKKCIFYTILVNTNISRSYSQPLWMSGGVAVQYSVIVLFPSTERCDRTCMLTVTGINTHDLLKLRPEVQPFHNDEGINVRRFRRQVTATQPPSVSNTHSPWWPKPVFLNRRAAARYRALASIIPGREKPEETTICYKISLVQLIIN